MPKDMLIMDIPIGMRFREVSGYYSEDDAYWVVVVYALPEGCLMWNNAVAMMFYVSFKEEGWVTSAYHREY